MTVHAGDTIAAVASPPGRSARALIRVSGPDARAVAADLCALPNFDRAVRPARLRLGGAGFQPASPRRP